MSRVAIDASRASTDDGRAPGEGRRSSERDDGWVTAGGRDHREREQKRSSMDEKKAWREEGNKGNDQKVNAEQGARERAAGNRGRKFKEEGHGRASEGSWGKRAQGEGRASEFGGKPWTGESASAEVKKEEGEAKRVGAQARTSRDGFPTRPTGVARGFTMGRGKSGGQALQSSLGALQVSSVSETFYERVMSKAAEGQFADASEGEETKAHPAKYRYSASELVAILRQLEAANACVMPSEVCATNVPMKSIQPGDPLWELTMIGRHGEWSKDEKQSETKAGGDDVPEWAQEHNALNDASMTDDSYLGTVMPGLTKEEREGFFGLSALPEPVVQAPPRTSRLVALEEEETIMPHMSHLGGIQGLMHQPQMQMPPVQMPAAQRPSVGQVQMHMPAVQMPPVQMPPVQMPPMQMPPVQMPPMQQMPPVQMPPKHQATPPQQPAPVPPNINWFYLDPSGQQQGPFSRQELIEWHQGGFFPNDLPCKPVDAPPQAPYMPLIELLQSGWRYHIPMQQQPMQQQPTQQPTQRMPPMRQPQQQQPQQQQQGGGGLPPWLANMPPPQGPSAGAAPMRGLMLEDLERSRQVYEQPQQQPQPPPRQAPPPVANALANFAAGLGISNQQGQAPPPQARGMTLAELEARQMHHPQGRREVASADASSQWDAPPAQRNQPPIPQAMPIPKAMPAPMPSAPPPAPPPARFNHEPEPALKAPSGPAWGGAAPASPSSVSKTLLDIQREEEARAAEAAKNAPPPSMHGASLGSAWGGQVTAGKSLKEIQEEEARAAERRAAAMAQQQQQYQSGLPSGGWAATAAAAVAKVVPRPAITLPTPVVRPPVPAPVASAPEPKARPAVLNAVAPLTQIPQAPSNSLSLPPLNNKNALRSWCKAQMSQLNNSDDMTLVDFLLGLPSAGEVQEYVALYLGKTPQAAAFAGELIRQKRADPSLADGLGNGELARVAASGSGGAYVDDGVDDDGDDEWADASRKKKGTANKR